MLDHRYANGVRATGVHSEHFGEIFCVEEDFGSGEDRFSFFPAAPAFCSPFAPSPKRFLIRFFFREKRDDDVHPSNRFLLITVVKCRIVDLPLSRFRFSRKVFN